MVGCENKTVIDYIRIFCRGDLGCYIAEIYLKFSVWCKLLTGPFLNSQPLSHCYGVQKSDQLKSLLIGLYFN